MNEHWHQTYLYDMCIQIDWFSNQPRSKRHLTTHVITLSFKTRRQEVHFQLRVAQTGLQHSIVHILHLAFVILDYLHVSDRPFRGKEGTS